MLNFFRKYQWYFFLVITIVVVISFSFFGTYNSLSSNSWREQVVFTAVDGKEITRSELDDMVQFLATDRDDKLLYGGAWGLNFFNDGVIPKDFLETGLAQELIIAYSGDLQQDLQQKIAREKKYRLYQHPEAKFLSVENTWNYFAPGMTEHWASLRSADNAVHPDALRARTYLYLGQKQLPAPMLKQVLRYQEKQYSWLTPDSDLDRMDLSLFGYHTLEDWFGPRFVRLVGQFIINAAILSEQKGYRVSDAEVMADLVRNAEISYKQNQNNPETAVASPQEYFNEQLRRMNMDRMAAVRVWRQVMLFRRYFQDVGNSVLVDTLPFEKLTDYANESVSVDLYRLPSELRLNDREALEKFEIYLRAVAKRPADDLVTLPTTFLTVNEVNKSYPELVAKRYLLEISRADKKSLRSRVGLKEMWSREVSDESWPLLKKRFPDLGAKKDATREERFAALDNLDSVTRAQVDDVAKTAIVDLHPEWLHEALDRAKSRTETISLRNEGGKAGIEGLDAKEKRKELSLLLDNALLGETPAVDSKLYAYSADGQNFYRIKVLARDAEPSILTFAEASQDGTLLQLRDRLLEKYYVSIRDKDPAAYQNEDKSWKTFESVKIPVSDQYAKNTLALNKLTASLQKKLPEDMKETLTPDQAAALRLFAHMAASLDKASGNTDEAESILRVKPVPLKQTDELPAREPLEKQWGLEKSEYSVKRNASGSALDLQEAFAMEKKAWSSVKTSPNGDLVFFQVKGKGEDPERAVAIAESTRKAHALLSAAAQRELMKNVLVQISNKKAISLSYLNRTDADESGSEPELSNE